MLGEGYFPFILVKEVPYVIFHCDEAIYEENVCLLCSWRIKELYILSVLTVLDYIILFSFVIRNSFIFYQTRIRVKVDIVDGRFD